jgi:hypothetical protein
MCALLAWTMREAIRSSALIIDETALLQRRGTHRVRAPSSTPGPRSTGILPRTFPRTTDRAEGAGRRGLSPVRATRRCPPSGDDS